MICREATFTITRSHPESHDEMTVRESESQCDCWAAQLYKHWATTGSQSGLPAFSALSWKCARLAQHFLLSFYSLIIVFIMINWVVIFQNINSHQSTWLSRENLERHRPVSDQALYVESILQWLTVIVPCVLGGHFVLTFSPGPHCSHKLLKYCCLKCDVWCVLYMLYCHDISNTFSILTG